MHSVLTDLRLQVNIPKTRRTYCKGQGCKKHTQHKVTQYKAGKVSISPVSATSLLSSDITDSGFIIRARKTKIRSQAVWIRRPDKTRLQKEGKDNEEGRFEAGVHNMQDKGTTGAEAMQAFRTRVCGSIRRIENLSLTVILSGDKKTKGAALVF